MRLISAAHLSLRRTKGAQRRGQLRPGFGGGPRRGRRPQALGPLPSTPAAWSQVRPERRAHSRQGPTHSRGQRAGVRAPPLGDNQRSHLNAPRSARVRRRPGPRAEGRVPRPRLPGPAPSPARFPGALKVDSGGSPSRPLWSLSPTCTARSTQLNPGAHSALGLIGSGDRLPTCDLPARAICISHHDETHTHAHTRTDRTEAHRGGGEKETREPAQIGTCGWF